MTPEQKKASTVLISRFIFFRKTIINIWRDYNYLDFSINELKKLTQVSNQVNIDIDNLYDTGKKKFWSKDINGMCYRLIVNVTPARTLKDAVSQTEYFLQDVGKLIHQMFPEKLNTKDSVEQIGQQIKLLQTILESTDKNEIIDKLIEEKMRGIFYGNPVDFFEKDKAKAGFNSYFKDNHKNALKQFAEIVARRNIYVHNNGKVDRKYLREVEGSTLKLGSTLPLTKDYLKQTIILLKDISGMTTKLILENVFHATHYHKFINSSANQFVRKFADPKT